MGGELIVSVVIVEGNLLPFAMRRGCKRRVVRIRSGHVGDRDVCSVRMRDLRHMERVI